MCQCATISLCRVNDCAYVDNMLIRCIVRYQTDDNGLLPVVATVL